MKKRALIFTSLALFFATATLIGMEEKYQPKVFIKNEVWSMTMSGDYGITVFVNNSLQEGKKVEGLKTEFLGNLNNINTIEIKRSGIGHRLSPLTTISLEQIKKEAPGNRGKDVLLIVCPWRDGYKLLSHRWEKIEHFAESKPTVINPSKPAVIDPNDPWSFFPEAKKFKTTLDLDVDIHEGQWNKISEYQKKNLTTFAKLVLGFDADATPSQADIKKSRNLLGLKFHPDKNIGETPALQTSREEALKIVNNAYGILTEFGKKNR
jgi:hypothetical protein